MPPSPHAHTPGRILTWTGLVCTVILLAHATGRFVLTGSGAFSVADWNRSDFFLSSGVPAVLLTPLFLLAFQRGRKVRYRSCGLLLAWGALLFGLILLVPLGVHAPGWYTIPVLILLVTCTFGAWPGIGQASVVVFSLLTSAFLVDSGQTATTGLSSVWVQAAFAGSAAVAMALFGSLLQKTLSLAISAEEDQNLRMDEARKALRHREHLLRHAMRIDTVGEMASMVVHQLRNQFQLILGYAAVGVESADERSAGHFQSIVQTLGQSNELLEGLLGMSRREAGRVEVVDLTALCQKLGGSYRKVLPASVRFEVEVPEHPVSVALDSQGLEHALLNLVINARQAIDGRGEIRIRLSVDEGSARLAIEDSGSGIGESDLPQIFKPFYTTKRKGEGTGLGLAAVQRFVVSSRGEIAVESRVGEGTVFTLSFPLASNASSQVS